MHKRRSLRLRGYDYSSSGAYFVTITSHKRIKWFGEIVDGEMILTELGRIAYNEWIKLPQRFPDVALDVFQIMPDHMHGIVIIKEKEESVWMIRSEASSDRAGDIMTTHCDVIQTQCRNVESELASDSDHSVDSNIQPKLTLGNIIQAYKSITTVECLRIYKQRNEVMGRVWHRNYHDRIIKSEYDYHHIADYIIRNPREYHSRK